MQKTMLLSNRNPSTPKPRLRLKKGPLLCLVIRSGIANLPIRWQKVIDKEDDIKN